MQTSFYYYHLVCFVFKFILNEHWPHNQCNRTLKKLWRWVEHKQNMIHFQHFIFIYLIPHFHLVTAQSKTLIVNWMPATCWKEVGMGSTEEEYLTWLEHSTDSPLCETPETIKYIIVLCREHFVPKVSELDVEFLCDCFKYAPTSLLTVILYVAVAAIHYWMTLLLPVADVGLEWRKHIMIRVTRIARRRSQSCGDCVNTVTVAETISMFLK